MKEMLVKRDEGPNTIDVPETTLVDANLAVPPRSSDSLAQAQALNQATALLGG
jgi:hypothetical protein